MSQMTKQLLAQALKQMLRKKTLEKMTISDLADCCGINRKTFYYHFKDIYDLVDYTVALDFRMALGDNNTYDTWQIGYLDVLKTARTDDSFLLSAFPTLEMEHVGRGLGKMVYDLLINIIEEIADGMDVDEKDKRLIADFYQHAIIGVTIDWLRGGMQEEPEYIAGLVGEIMHGSIDRMLELLRRNAPRKKRASTDR